MTDLPHYDDIHVRVTVDGTSSDGVRRNILDIDFPIEDHETFSADSGPGYLVLHYENADIPPFAVSRKVGSILKDILTSGVKRRGQA